MYKLIAIDIDGTLLNDQHEITEETFKTLEEAKHLGVKIVLCSGRPIGGMNRYIKALGLDQAGDYAISYNGGLVQDTYHLEKVVEYSLNHDHLKELYELSISLGTPMHFFDEKGLYTPNQDISAYTVYEAYLNNIPLHYREMDHVPVDISLPKIMYIDHPESLERLIPKIPEKMHQKYTIVQSAPHFLEFVHPETNKGVAVKKLAEHLGIKQDKVMSIGDNGNDLAMIEYAGCGVAMGNSIPEVKAAADFETLSNNENGVAHAIKELVLKPLQK